MEELETTEAHERTATKPEAAGTEKTDSHETLDQEDCQDPDEDDEDDEPSEHNDDQEIWDAFNLDTPSVDASDDVLLERVRMAWENAVALVKGEPSPTMATLRDAL